jgi:2-(1,2-epoxy-1,2-dihydrophenyl)acetyl-CoA isomerase
MNYTTMLIDQSEGVVTITLNRPSKLNALNHELLDELADAIEKADKDDDAKAVVFTGQGRGFCSGADLTGPVSGTDPNADGVTREVKLSPFARFGNVFMRLNQTKKPTIAAVNGIASGGGFSLAAACDIRIASTAASFSAIFVRRGLVADCGLTFTLPRLVGSSKALEMMWTGEFLSADEALHCGLISRIVSPEALLEEARSLALKIATGPSVAIESMKQMVYKGLENDSFDAQLAWEAFSQSVCFQTDDFKEGVSSFLEKREPEFKGR